MALIKLVVRTPRKLLEVVSAVLFEAGAGGIEELDNGRRLVVYAASKEDAEGIAARARELLREAAPEPSGVALSVEVDEKSDWDTAWTKHLGQVALTPRIVIQPLWDETPAPIGSRRILFDPKLAFGDGEHPTTRLAAEFLESECEKWPDARVLDFGSGTGVLAFVALLSGAEFACGVDIVGPSSLVSLIESFPDYWKPFMESSWYRRVGNPAKADEREHLLSRSPITRIDQVQRPILVAQGANDPRVTKKESDQMVAGLVARKTPVTYVLYADEGHGFARPENRISFYAISEGFLAKCLGGRAEALGTFQGAKISVPEGADAVPGLAQAVSMR